MTPGAFRYDGENEAGQPKWLIFPCQAHDVAPDETCSIPINGQALSTGAIWTISGPPEAPSVSPSIHCKGVCHFWIHAGKIEPCGDYL